MEYTLCNLSAEQVTKNTRQITIIIIIWEFGTVEKLNWEIFVISISLISKFECPRGDDKTFKPYWLVSYLYFCGKVDEENRNFVLQLQTCRLTTVWTKENYSFLLTSCSKVFIIPVQNFFRWLINICFCNLSQNISWTSGLYKSYSLFIIFLLYNSSWVTKRLTHWFWLKCRVVKWVLVMLEHIVSTGSAWDLIFFYNVSHIVWSWQHFTWWSF